MLCFWALLSLIRESECFFLQLHGQISHREHYSCNSHLFVEAEIIIPGHFSNFRSLSLSNNNRERLSDHAELISTTADMSQTSSALDPVQFRKRTCSLENVFVLITRHARTLASGPLWGKRGSGAHAVLWTSADEQNDHYLCLIVSLWSLCWIWSASCCRALLFFSLYRR